MKIIKTKRNCIFLLLSITVITIALTSCKTQRYNNFVTYFNTFYNAERLMKECESEFEFQSEKKRVTPKILVPMPQNEELKRIDGAAPAFLAGLKVDRASRQAVNTKLDSIIIKGSKILAKSPRSNYVVPSLYLMAKTYFYKEEWMPSQIKCSEVIDKDPEGKFSADAHLLMAMNLLMQGKYDAGLTMLSRTVDVAWLNGRYDILTKAFHIEAEMALYYGDLEGAVRPYFQAIAQSDDRQAQALWQNEMAAILFRMGRFDRAEKAFAKVSLFKPDLVTRYEADLYRASSLIRLGQIEEANRILYRLDNDGKFEEWKDYVMTQRLVQSLLHGTSEQTKMMEFQIDSLYPTSEAKAAYFFEKGVKDFEEGNYVDARSAIAKARNSRTPFIGQPATKLFRFFNEREIYVKNILNCFESVEKIRNPNNMSRNENSFNENNFNENSEENSNSGENNSGEKVFVEVNQTPSVVIQQVPIDEQIDRLLGEAAKNYFELARLYFNIGNIDTAHHYYKAAADIAPLSMESSARYLYVYSESIRDTNAWKADSILHEIVNSQPKTEFGQAAMAKLGYTAAFVTDSVLTLYNSGYELMRFKEYNLARVQFKRVFTEHPENLILAPKSLYALGYMFEHNLKNFDSAKYYYSILIEKYPNSVYAQELALPVKYKTLVDNNSPIPDSLKSRNVDIYEFDIDEIINAPYDSTLISKPPQKGGSIMDDLKNP
ncbi:MAG: tetratricopeptide repeat protein, partial [Firmicutes bacterium]|nr:tetratricopeptide repeat protein [Bacillota bacterium]